MVASKKERLIYFKILELSIQNGGLHWDLFPNQYLFQGAPIFCNANNDLFLD